MIGMIQLITRMLLVCAYIHKDSYCGLGQTTHTALPLKARRVERCLNLFC